MSTDRVSLRATWRGPETHFASSGLVLETGAAYDLIVRTVRGGEYVDAAASDGEHVGRKRYGSLAELEREWRIK